MWQSRGRLARIRSLSPDSLHVSALIAAGGRGLRFGAAQPKQTMLLGGQSLLERSVRAIASCPLVTDIVVALPEALAADPPPYLRDGPVPIEVVAGGARRRDSVARAFARVTDRADIVVIHDAARPLVTGDTVARTVAAAARWGAAVAALPAHDTVKQVDREGVIAGTLSREAIYLAQTPQAFRTSVLAAALAIEGDATDEAALAEQAGFPVHVVAGDPWNLKITNPGDLDTAERLLGAPRPASTRIGIGYDLHRLVEGRPLVLGGVTVPFEKGLQGHSDADVICHAVTDAILGAAAAGDIGRHFPDTDDAWKGADSLALLREAAAIARRAGFSVVNVDVVLIAERPRLAPHVDRIRANLSTALQCDPSQVSVKGKTNERVDSMGAGESMAAHAVALLEQVLP